MKKFTKILCVLLALSLLITLAACAKKEEEKKVLTMATNAEFPPYEFYQDGKIVEENRPEELFGDPKSERLRSFLAKVL